MKKAFEIKFITAVDHVKSGNHICSLAKDILLNRFQSGNFYVVPRLISGDRNTIHFPDLKYSAEFWETISKNSSSNLNDEFPLPAVNEVRTLLRDHDSQVGNTEKIIDEWNKIGTDILDKMFSIFDFTSVMQRISEIQVLLTPYGSAGAFNPPLKGDNHSLFVTSRIDFSAASIALPIFQSLYIMKTNNGGEIGDNEYLKRMQVVNFIIKNTSLSIYYPDFVSPIERINIDKNVIDESNQYLQKLGVGTSRNNLPSELQLSKFESRVYKALMKADGTIVTYDQIADCIWRSEASEKYSLVAIAKIIENLRSKVRKSGVNKAVIMNARGKGYFMNTA